MLKEIGSNFWISPEETRPNHSPFEPQRFGVEGSDFVWMSSGRSAIRIVLETIGKRHPEVNKTALLPSFTCHTVIEPFLDFGYQVIAIPMDEHLASDADTILELQARHKAGIVLVHRYYGFDTLPDFDRCVVELRNKGVMVIEDCTQSLYSCVARSDADFLVGSIRKWCGVPDGGFAVCKEGTFENKPEECDVELEQLKLDASRLKYDYIFQGLGEKSIYKEKYGKAEGILAGQTRFFSIGKFSQTIQLNLNVPSLKARRRINYQTLLDGLKDVPGLKIVFDELKDEVTPLYFPVFVDDRGGLQGFLADNDIYAPVVWPKAACCPKVDETTDNTYCHLLCIPIDQRYEEDDMNRIIKVIKQFYETQNSNHRS